MTYNPQYGEQFQNYSPTSQKDEKDRLDFTLVSSPSRIIFSIGNENFTFLATHHNFKIAKELAKKYSTRSYLKNKHLIKIRKLFDIKVELKEWSNGQLTFTSNSVIYKDGQIPESLINHLLNLFKSGDTSSFSNWEKFIQKINETQSSKIFKRLHLFLQHNDLSIDSDGDILAYKVVSTVYKDKYTGTIDNSVGAEPSVPRISVDDNDSNYCSHGLHVCSYDYLKEFASYGDPVMLVKIDVRDIISIPLDYDGQKIRCCRYKVIRELGKWSDSDLRVLF